MAEFEPFEPFQLIDAPLEWRECPACDGEGRTVHRISVYEAGCGFRHDDSEERRCERCDGHGGWIDERRSDR